MFRRTTPGAGTLGKEMQGERVAGGRQVKAWAAEFSSTPDGKYLYASERTSTTLSGLKVDAATGQLTPVGSSRPRAAARLPVDPTGRYLLRSGGKPDS